MGTLSERLRRLRARKSMSVAEVARAIGVAPSTYREWEEGRQIKGEPYQKLAELYGVTLSEVVIGSGGKMSILDDLREIENAVKRIRTHL